MPEHISLCHKSLLLNRGSEIDVHILGPEDIPSLNLDLHPAWNELQEPAHKADYLRVAILARYGGFWLDSDTIVLRPYTHIVELLSQADMVGWEYRSGGPVDMTTYRLPIGAFGVQPNLELMQLWKRKIDHFFETKKHLGRENWHAIGRQMMNPLLKEAAGLGRITYVAFNAEQTTIPFSTQRAWRYFERAPLSNVISESSTQTHISYFNSWMSRVQVLSRDDIMNGDEQICRIFQYALEPQKRSELIKQRRVPIKLNRRSLYLPLNNFGHYIRRTLSIKKRWKKLIENIFK
jgi:glycosyl transferase-like sugar-binding protein